MGHDTIIDDPAFLQVASPKFVFLDPKVLRPLPQSLWNISCEECDKRQSVWEHFPPELPSGVRKGTPVCSLCWLYESAWGKENREAVDCMIRAVEVQKEEIFRKAGDGCLWSCRDADRILGAIGVTSRIAEHHARMAMFGGDDGS